MIYQDEQIMLKIMRASGIQPRQIQALVVLRARIRRGGIESTPESLRLDFQRYLSETGRYADDGSTT